MKQMTQTILISVIAFIGALIFLGLSVYPFQYGFLESVLLAEGFVVLSLVEFVVDDAAI
ncbi:hypothetical protein HTZ84_13320 [Haloterrigena sp. SYSU A558-1]|uniref:Uncharacterized protein n=1 Tax=Haloterrigena gelatinilytica TaxID=2741724 RepID=A0ABX2LDQ7_9EURY|nr:hypothetical protein [Haloterrigena gelatinilytica]NUC73279.1 hypothetical protein [Haloterrigena gelatinilytica]